MQVQDAMGVRCVKENTEPISYAPGAKALLEMVSTLPLMFMPGWY